MAFANVLLFIFAYMLVRSNLIVNSFVNVFIILFIYFFLLVNNISNLYNKDDKEYVDSVLQGAQINELKTKLATAGIE